VLSIFSNKKIPLGLPEEISELQQNWDAFLLKMEEQYRTIITAGHDNWEEQLHTIIQQAKDTYQSQPLAQYNTLHALYADNPLATDLLDHFRNKIYHVLLQWERRLIMLQEKAIREIAGLPDKTYIMVSSDDDVIYHTYYGIERKGSTTNR
jgi:hypothetical protein